MNTAAPPLEICIACDSQEEALLNARAAASGGADRLECCASMHVGGLTPDPRIIEEIREAVPAKVAVLAMVRPRGGAFEWNTTEADTMQQSIQDLAAAGADGVVSGALRSGTIDAALTRKLISLARHLSLDFTFHRAIDAVEDRTEALNTLMDLGCQSILTAGTRWGATDGALDGIKELTRTARQLKGRMEIVVGGGVSAVSLPQLRDVLSHHEKISFHAYSAAMTGEQTDAGKVAALRQVIAMD